MSFSIGVIVTHHIIGMIITHPRFAVLYGHEQQAPTGRCYQQRSYWKVLLPCFADMSSKRLLGGLVNGAAAASAYWKVLFILLTLITAHTVFAVHERPASRRVLAAALKSVRGEG